MNKYIGAIALFALASCTNTKQNTDKVTDSTAVTTKSNTQTVSLKDPKVQAIYADYIVLKDALVDSKYDEARTASKSLSAKLANYQGCENTALIANKINDAKDIAEQRKEFTFLSSDIIAMFKHADLQTGSIFVQHCPMANHGDGGDWLSSNKQIQNPYFGDEMIDCGAVIEEIKGK